MYTGISRMPKNKYYFLLMAFGISMIGIMAIEFLCYCWIGITFINQMA